MKTTCFKNDCFANRCGECSILKDTDFGKRDCPFFKDRTEAAYRSISPEHRPVRQTDSEEET